MTRRFAFGFFLGLVSLCAASAGCDRDGNVQPTPLSVASVSPNAGSTLGATRVVISGGGFKTGARVEFGGVAAEVNTVSSTTITATAPAHAEGPVTVAVTNPDGKSATRASAYTYEVDPVFAVSGLVTEMTDEGEVPVEDVLVTNNATGSSVLTDAKGAYRLGGLRRSTFVLVFSKPGYFNSTKSVMVSSDMQLDLRVERFVTFVLSGLVYEATASGPVPLDGVVLYCDACGSPVGHTFATTDVNGLYSFAWTRNGKNWIQFHSKEGYRYAGPIELFGIPVNVNGDTRFDIELVKR